MIVPALNAASTLPATLAALAEQDLDGSFEVIVVDNGSDDETADLARADEVGATVLQQARQRAGAARNRGAAAAAAPILAFTDADCAPAADWLRRGLEAIDAGADLVQGAVRPDPSATPAPFDRTLRVEGEFGLYETANLFVRAELFERVGGFEDCIPEADLAVPFGEDAWFGWRARRAGARTAFSDGALVHHAVFRRDWRAYAGERRRAALFPALVAHIPELRASTLYQRVFLSRRTALFDLAAAGILAACLRRSRTPLLVALPYAAEATRASKRWRRRAPQALLAAVAADCVTLASLVRGSYRWRTPVV